ncbi:MAG: Ig-like domain repeat protein [Solirubrobacteraceae bacterium]
MGAALLFAALSLFAGAASGAIPAWTTYRHDTERSGIDPESTSPLPPAQLWQTGTLDGSIYTEPLVYGSQVYVATENDTIYSLDAATGAIAWEAHLGTPVPSTQLPCGDIEPTVGITGTPVIDPATKTIYAVTDTWDGTHAESIRHMLVALELGTGAMRPGFPIDVDPPFPSGGSAAEQLQRAALALDGNEVVIGYGGNDGDCATYWGWLVGAPESGAGPLRSYQVDSKSGDDEGAIWGAGNGPADDSSGDLYAATGNGTSGPTYDYGDSVLKLDSNLELLEAWAPADWQKLDEHDQDLGSSDPVLLPDELAFEIGKQGVGVLLHTDALGGVGAAPTAELGVCGGSWGGGIYVAASASAGTLYVTCSDGLNAVSVSALGSAEPKLSADASWKVDGNAVGPPIFAGGLVWVASYEGKPGYLYGLDPSTGAVKFESNLGSFEHFSTPGAGDGRLFAANGNKVTAFTIAATPAPSPTTTALTSSADPSSAGQPVTFTAAVSPVPDSGTVSFTDGGATIAGCDAVSVSEANGHASCQTTYGLGGAHSIVASYSGDPYYAGSASSPLIQAVFSSGAPPLVLRVTVSDLRQSHVVWREGNRTALVSATGKTTRPPVGTTFSFSLNQQARVTFRFTRRVSGRRVGRMCLAITNRNRRHRRCERTVTAGIFPFAAPGGTSKVVFQGRLPHTHKLAPGRYTLIVTASNATGTSAPKSLVFTIVG